MKCPACSNTLSSVKAGEIVIDFCQKGCRGLWFDWQELKKFDEQHELLPQAVFSAEAHATKPSVSHDLRACPKCEGEQILCRRWYDMKNEVEVDQCLRCSGIFLDSGEITAIRAQYETEEERVKAADAWLADGLKEVKERLDINVMQRMNITQAEYDRYLEEGIRPSTLTRLLHRLVGKV